MTFSNWQAIVRPTFNKPFGTIADPILDKAVGGVGYVEDHQSPVEFLQKDALGIGAYGAASVKVAV